MIPKPYIAKWQEHAPWKEFSQVEQDLIISRVLIEIFNDEFLKENLAFRGGTALHKLYGEYTSFSTGNRPPSKKEFLLNMEEKENSAEFIGDMEGLLRTGIAYDQGDAFYWLKSQLIERM